MKLKHVKIKNFRALDEVEMEFGDIANIICGPNATGKSSILDAIRLAKSVLSPRILNEGQQVLFQLQAASPHYPQSINLNAIAGDPTRSTLIETTYRLDDDEVSQLPALKGQLIQNLLQNELASTQQGPLDLVQFLSTPIGLQAREKADKLITDQLPDLLTRRECKLRLQIDAANGFQAGADLIGSLVIASLERAQPLNLALLSFFPADRALPAGEVNVQLGGQDAAQLAQTHIATPQSKYSRLKQTIVNSNIVPYPGGRDISGTFDKIFANLLVGRTLEKPALTSVGQLIVPVRDRRTNRVFDIDALSSGEKGLILTLLLIEATIAKNGIVVLDEPELHLNPALCRRLLPFLIDEYLTPLSRQAIICSHSPEIVASAFDDKRCQLFNLVGPKLISPILGGDQDELYAALEALGAGLEDVLFSRGTIYVEGDDDRRILSEGFGEKLSRYRVVQMRGRNNIEKEIRNIQDADSAGNVTTPHFFIFDLDHKPTTLVDTQHVKIMQWKQRSIDNYLLDENAIYDVVCDEDVACQARPERRGDVLPALRELAWPQMSEDALAEAYSALNYENPGLRPKDVRGKPRAAAISAIEGRLLKIKEQLSTLSPEVWRQSLENAALELERQKEIAWERDWKKLCNAKRALEALHHKYGVRLSVAQFKRRIVREMKKRNSPAFQDMAQELSLILAEAREGGAAT